MSKPRGWGSRGRPRRARLWKIGAVFTDVGTWTQKDARPATPAALRGPGPGPGPGGDATDRPELRPVGSCSRPPAGSGGRAPREVRGARGVTRAAGACGAGPRRGRGGFRPRNARTRADSKAGALRGALRAGPPRGARPEATCGERRRGHGRRGSGSFRSCSALAERAFGPLADTDERGPPASCVTVLLGAHSHEFPLQLQGTFEPNAQDEAEPLRKKKKVDPKKDQAVKDRLKKRIRRLEKASQELIPIEDFIIPAKLLDKTRQRPKVELPFEESERRALLLKKWSLYKHQEHEKERDAITSMLESQQEALQELKLISPELHEEATKRDPNLFPFEREGPDYTPPISSYQPPEGRYHDITKVYTQVEFKR